MTLPCPNAAIRDNQSRKAWAAIYEGLSEGLAGLLGAVTSRAEAQTMRLAMIYALLDQSPVIRPEHLMAGLAVWQYCEQSARYIFGSAMGDLAEYMILCMLARQDYMRLPHRRKVRISSESPAVPHPPLLASRKRVTV